MCQGYADSLNAVIAEQEKNAELLQRANEKLTQALDASEQANKALKQIIEAQKKREVLKEKKCAEDIKKAKPGFFRDAGIFGLGGITGAVITIVGILFL
jgi:lipid II:glycine glycyltransferase (peptidoglycan interpeptide bridge formation enzyme)